jgi:hypothetical protein
MKTLLMTLFLSFAALGLAVGDAEAARFGGGRSFSAPRRMAPKPAAPARAPAASPARQAAPAAPAKAPAAGPSPARQLVAGMAAGIGLTALFSHLGISEKMAYKVMILLLVIAALFVFRMLSRSRVE